MIDLQYADDISWITNISEPVTEIEEEAPSKLEEKNLQVNNTKTEKHDIERNGQTEWMKCKFLGSLLDTEYDIKRRKGLALGTYNDLKHIFENKRASTAVKIRIMNSHLESIFLYNSELWTMTKGLEHVVDVFQRNFLRKILNIKWPEKDHNGMRKLEQLGNGVRS